MWHMVLGQISGCITFNWHVTEFLFIILQHEPPEFTGQITFPGSGWSLGIGLSNSKLTHFRVLSTWRAHPLRLAASLSRVPFRMDFVNKYAALFSFKSVQFTNGIQSHQICTLADSSASGARAQRQEEDEGTLPCSATERWRCLQRRVSCSLRTGILLMRLYFGPREPLDTVELLLLGIPTKSWSRECWPVDP